MVFMCGELSTQRLLYPPMNPRNLLVYMHGVSRSKQQIRTNISDPLTVDLPLEKTCPSIYPYDRKTRSVTPVHPSILYVSKGM